MQGWTGWPRSRESKFNTVGSIERNPTSSSGVRCSMQMIRLCVLCCLLLLLQACKRTTEESVSETRNGDYKVVVRSQEFNNSGIRNLDFCVAETASHQFPQKKSQCFLHGFDFTGLSVKWRSQRIVEISFACGRVDQFRNSAFVYPEGPVPEEFYVILQDSCNSTLKDDPSGGSRR